jgi:hypothetical protein
MAGASDPQQQRDIFEKYAASIQRKGLDLEITIRPDDNNGDKFEYEIHRSPLLDNE